MEYGLGIDAGGTFTDAVILKDGKIAQSIKAPTTYPDPLGGIRQALDGLDPAYLEKVSRVSISTTLATNSVLENTVSESDSGYSVALIMIGEIEVPEGSHIPWHITVRGGHNANGLEARPLDIDAIRSFILEVKDNVSAFAVSSYFSIRNPDHELRAKALIKEMTAMPVVCGHELSLSLGSYERGVTAYLNARLFPITRRFMGSVVREMEDRNIEARVVMLKCDGSVVSLKEALERPVESIFTGPASSLLGASYLSGKSDCLVIDVGGTSTDVSRIAGGIPEVTDEGAVIGGWATRVRAIRMETSAMGGDSHIWVRNGQINIGPRRVIPLCVAAQRWPCIVNKLKRARLPSKIQLDENFQPTKFFVRSTFLAHDLSSVEAKLLESIGTEPVAINEISMEGGTTSLFLDMLIRKKLIDVIGFTPTDALHVLGEHVQWDIEASLLGAGVLGKLVFSEGIELCRQIKTLFSENMAACIMSYLLKEVPREHILQIIKNRDKNLTRFKIDVPFVLLGGPVGSYVEDMREMLATEVILPEHAAVGNAVGGLAGRVVKRTEILIRRSFEGKRASIMLFSSSGNERFNTYPQALEKAISLGKGMVMRYLVSSGLKVKGPDIEIIQQDIRTKKEDIYPLETKLVFIGTGEVSE